jgi:YgiT-type zinc finger domain-containing protein
LPLIRKALNRDVDVWGGLSNNHGEVKRRSELWMVTSMVCDICGQTGAQIRRVSRSYGQGASLFVIENVPIISCPHCGESYLSAETLHEIERIKMHRHAWAQERPVAVAAFA